MPESPQIPNMDAKQAADQLLIERYLAGHLTDADADAFEDLLLRHPELSGEVERVARMKTGLALLRERGELTALLKEPPRDWYQKSWAAAAAVLVCAFGLGLYFATVGSSAPALLANSLAELSRQAGAPMNVVKVVAISRTRGAGDLLSLDSSNDAPGAIELRLSTGAQPAAVYSAELLRTGPDGLESLGRVPGVGISTDGTATFFVSAETLSPGDYLIRLWPAEGDMPLEFPLRVGAASR